ncbi:MAG TPA: serpin family protein [Gemmatimonadaceae bacterium]|jgi:serpin B|nr:serpin family protein [Gemmatimonadaceae bacterium]
MSFAPVRHLGRHIGIVAPAIVVILSVACRGDSSTAPSVAPAALTQLPRPLSAVEQQLVTSSNGFAFSLFRDVDSSAGPDSNVFISPLSASMALGMTAVGAAGPTLDSMRAVLGYRGLPVSQMADAYHSLITLLGSLDPAVDFRIANAIWYDHSLDVLPSFVSTAQSDFGAPVTAEDFSNPALTATINNWVNANTAGKIPTLINGPLSVYSVMFLADAMYFHGLWTQQFDVQRTRDTLFTTSSGATVPVQLMHVETSAPLYSTPRYTAVDLSYGRNAYVMTVIVPATGVSLDSVIIALRNGEWSTLSNALDMSSGTTQVQVDLPKFTLTWGDTLNAPLKALGMGIAFDDTADFSNMATLAPNQRLKISTVFQKTFVDVDETGTTAAAATGVGIVITALPVSPPVVRADHPFVYVVRERLSGTVLFVGAFRHPPPQS